MQTLSTAAHADALTGNRPAAAPATLPRPKKAGRERTCHQCGTVYRSITSASRYCTPACRKRAARGTAATGGPKAGPDTWGPITRALRIGGYVGRIGPLSPRSPQPETFGLLVDAERAYRDLAALFDAKGWGFLTRAEFDEALKDAGIRGLNTRPEATLERNRKRAKKRSARLRAF